jgi:hypothetical protein
MPNAMPAMNLLLIGALCAVMPTRGWRWCDLPTVSPRRHAVGAIPQLEIREFVGDRLKCVRSSGWELIMPLFPRTGTARGQQGCIMAPQ